MQIFSAACRSVLKREAAVVQVHCPAWAEEINCAQNQDGMHELDQQVLHEQRDHLALGLVASETGLLMHEECKDGFDGPCQPGICCTRQCAYCTQLAAQVYQPHACELHAWDAHGFDSCLAERKIILIGDSMMRQMFQSLACLLAPVTVSEYASNWSSTSATGDINNNCPAFVSL